MGTSTWPLWTALFPVASFLLTLVGIWLFKRARRKVDDHPICRKCGFDLFGAPQTSTRCPECGNELATPRATRVGNHAISKPRRAIASVVILLSLLVTAFIGREVYNRVNFQPIKPDWWLALELGSTDPMRRGAAISTLFERAEAGEVSEANCLKLESVLLELMPRFAALPNQIHWLNERILGDPSVSTQRLEALARAHLGNQVFSVRSKVSAGDPLPVEMVIGAHYRSWAAQVRSSDHVSDRKPVLFATMTQALSARIDGAGPFKLASASSLSDQGADLTSRTAAVRNLAPDQIRMLKPGKHSIELKVGLAVRVEMRTETERDEYLPKLDARHVRTIAQLTTEETRTFELLPQGQPSSSLVADESLRDRIAACIKLEPFPKSSPTHSMLSIGSLPAGVAFEVFFCQDGRETRVGAVSSPPRRGLATAVSYPDDAKPGPAELVFKPNLKLATNAVEVYDIWDGELRIAITVGEVPSTVPAP